MINVNELYLEVKGKWKSIYPIYFDSTKTIAEGINLCKLKEEDFPKVYALKTQKYSKLQWRWVHYRSGTSLSHTKCTQRITSALADLKFSWSMITINL